MVQYKKIQFFLIKCESKQKYSHFVLKFEHNMKNVRAYISKNFILEIYAHLLR
jgi:hypothetical protein